MIIQIFIECISINDLTSHLQAIKETVNKMAAQQKLDALRDSFNHETFSDDNCYGQHIVTIIEP